MRPTHLACRRGEWCRKCRSSFWYRQLLFRYAGFLFLFEEGHHFAQLAADLLDGLIAGRFAHGEEFVAAGLVLIDPLARELAGLHFGQDLLHLRAHVRIDDAWAAGV